MKKLLSVVAVSVVLTAIFVSDASSQTRIRFARGRTSASVAGYLAGNEIRAFVLAARNGQQLTANVSSGNGCVKFVGEGTSQDFTTSGGDNGLRIINDCGRRTNFTLTVSVH